jgi:hypothetical protein
MTDKQQPPPHGEKVSLLLNDGSKPIAKGILTNDKELSSRRGQGLQSKQLAITRSFGPPKPYRNAEGVLVCPPAYAKGFHHNKFRE